MEFLLANIELVGGGLVAIALIIYALFTKQWAALRIAAYQLMLSAEKLMATEEGKAKFEAVFTELWEKMPAWIRIYAKEQSIREKLQEWYDMAKDMIKGEKG